MNNLGHKLKFLRKYKGYLQRDIAKVLQITERQYSSYEAGKVDPPSSKLITLADHFDVPLDYLAERGIYLNWEEMRPHAVLILQTIKGLLDQYKLPIIEDEPDYCEYLLIQLLPFAISRVEIDKEMRNIDVYPSVNLPGWERKK